MSQSGGRGREAEGAGVGPGAAAEGAGARAGAGVGSGAGAGAGTMRRSAVLAFAVFGGIAAWVIHLGASYALVPVVCASGRGTLLHLMTAAMALLAAGATWTGWRARRGFAETEAPPEPGGPVLLFLARFGFLLSAFFLLLILVGGLPAFLHGGSVCPGPIPDDPIIRRGPAESPVWAASLLLIHGAWPLPAELWTAWSWDPWVGGAVLSLSALYLAGVTRLWRQAGIGRGIPKWRVAAYLGGIAALVLAVLSPIHALGGALFSVHMVQHMLLMVVAAPLLVLGSPMVGTVWGMPKRVRGWIAAIWNGVRPLRVGARALRHPLMILVLHVGALWLWHVPDLYQAALESDALHRLEHASFFLTALLFWGALVEVGRGGRWPGYGAGVLYVFGTALQSGALGALLLFSPSPWYPAHAEGTAAWGFDLLVDQQVAGAIMWIPAGLAYVLAAVVLFLAWMRESEAGEVEVREEGAGVG